MNFIEQVNITHTKLDYLINATNTYKDLGLFFLGEITSKEYVIIDVLNFGFLIFFPFFSKLFNIDVVRLINYFFILIFIGSLVFTLISSHRLCRTKSKIIPLYVLIVGVYLMIYKFILTTNAEYFIYFLWGILPLTYYSIANYNNKVQIGFSIIISILIIILGSLVYYSYLSFLFFYLLAIYFDKQKFNNKILLILPVLSVLFLLSLQAYSNKQAVTNISKIDNSKVTENNRPRNIGNNVYVVFYAGLGYLTSDHFDGYFHDDEIYKLTGKINKDGEILDLGINNVTKLSEEDISLVKEKIFYFIFKKPFFVFKVIFAKIGVLIGFFLIICNIFLIYFFSSKFNFNFRFPLLINLLFSSIIPVISIPSKFYSLSFFGASLVILLISVCINKKLI